jgi:hypothetical protein
MVEIDLSNAGFWLQFGIYGAAFIAGMIYYFKSKKKGELAPPQLMQMFTNQTTLMMEWFWKAIADGVITKDEAEELKKKLKINFESTIDMIIKLYTAKIPEGLDIPEVTIDPPEPVSDDEISDEEPPSGGSPPLPE